MAPEQKEIRHSLVVGLVAPADAPSFAGLAVAAVEGAGVD